jgi:iron complex outermembrane receptor protein
MRGVDGNDRTRSTGLQSFMRYDFDSRTSLSARIMGSDDFVQNNISPTAAGIPASNITGVIVPAIALPQDQVRRLLNGQTPIYGSATFIPGRDDPDNRRASRFYTSAIRVQHSLSSFLNLQTSYQRVHTRRIFSNGPAGSGFQPPVPDYSRFLGDIDTVDVRANADLFRVNHFTAGYEFERERYGEIQDNNLLSAQRIRTETIIRQNARAAYFQNQTNLLANRLQISLSGRVQTFALQKPVFNTTGVASNYDRLQLTSPPKATTADASVSYFVESTGSKLRAHAGNAYRAPGLFERFGGGFFLNPSGVLVFSPYGDPFLSPDRYISVDGGVDQYLWRDHARISATYFYTRVATITAFDLGTTIIAGSDPYGRTQGYVNGLGGLSRGLELSADVRPSGQLSLRGSYTYTRAATDRDVTIPGFWRVMGAPRHASTLVATQEIGNRASIAVDLVHNSEVFGNLSAAGRVRAYRFPAFAKVDVSGSFDVGRSDKGTIQWTARVDNIFNRTVYDLGWLAPRTTFVTGLSLRF